MNNLEKLAESCRKLIVLAKDPQFGLMTWNQFLLEQIYEIESMCTWTRLKGPQADTE